ncbi:hypothetical protein H310_01091 [Aphanomyces invadans]|uniref:Uncharacterized protein n=1 Tax=Aphanomyces invadans TaxID=157072 RepID=A0A024USB5_9STRA|nr:hypothetical protein H310_01091 [Aphanomyces invadans]ETW08528.1 hypothetical protein H310_01091 [Aphanomyces invadans]|eukprot:XP_008862333.1 hypothetical protein H310_01091 [Aphanomyces invadans]
MEPKRLPPSPRGGIPPKLERPGVTSSLTSPRAAPLVPPQAQPGTTSTHTHYNESTWLRDDEFICDAYYASQSKARKTTYSSPSRPVQAALLHRQCVEVIAQCTQSLKERQQKMAELTLPFAPLRNKSGILTPTRDSLASPSPGTRLFESSISPILPANNIPQPTPEPLCDVRKRLSFLDDSENEDKSLHSVTPTTLSSDLSTEYAQASDGAPGGNLRDGTML